MASGTIKYLAAKGSVAESRTAMLESATSEFCRAVGRLNDVALMEGHSKTFKLIRRAANEKTTKTTKTKLKVEVNSKRRRVDAPPAEPSSGAADPPGLPDLPTDVLRGSLLPFISGHRDDPATLTPHNTIALCRTSEAVGSAVEAALIADIDSIIQRHGLTGVIGYTPLRQSSHGSRLVRRMRLIRLHYVMVTGGDWRGNVPLLRMSKSCGRVQQLPIELTGVDLHQVGSKAVIDSRPPSMRQYALFSHRRGEGMRLRRTANGRDELGGSEVVVHTEQTVPVRYRDRFDAADPPCEHDIFEHGSFRELAIKRLASLSSQLVSSRSYRRRSAECDRIGDLIDQQPPLWDGCRTIDYNHSYGRSHRLVMLCGDREGDEFVAYIWMANWGNGVASIILYTTEAPQQIGSGPAVFPRAVDIAHNKMGDAITLLPKVNELIKTAVGVASSD
ncbi:unnamed protein product [Vitrella brassicaformis CCMP3155]|uniref:Uncharacterized protein n=1 Tax=Vitrella brassicaformis (strain CCMP3155) TaxID=1169540 RepID=A0A0G4EF75_VITBC|nr:unnamed protein product [Vitrella brassicaformis CCMP3155]|eukprot:CEL94379.1 unnamed protein product [Vitrella brassicaformis CCMP3155]